ncbi:MAG: NADH:flavin oxidoreductase [Proteobacteria bacterium]|nr:NADH:flavin oxidoreductase [Pseudomonadota bacterium]
MSNEILFKTFESPKLNLANRIVMAPMTRRFSPNGVTGQNVAEYYRKRTEGGVGLIITEGTMINHPAASFDKNIPNIYGEASLKGWKNVVDTVHRAGGKIVPQIWHVGSARQPGTGPFPETESSAPSGLLAPGLKKLPILSVEEIEKIVVAFAEAAFNAKEMGFDGVEVHGAHGYLIDQFFWEGTNQRTDKYGGSLENRTRFAIEIIEAIRKRVGSEFPIILRFSQWKQQDYNAVLAKNPQELEQFLTLLTRAGVDIFHASTRRFWLPEFDGSDLNLAGWTQKITGLPTISVGSVSLDDDFHKAFTGGEAQVTGIEKLIERMNRNEFDLIALGRTLITNPDWANKVKEGAYDQIKPFLKGALNNLV